MAEGLAASMRNSKSNGGAQTDFRPLSPDNEFSVQDKRAFASPSRSSNNSQLPRRLPAVSNPPLANHAIPVTVEYHGNNAYSSSLPVPKTIPASRSWPVDDMLNGSSNFNSYRGPRSPENKPPLPLTNNPRSDTLREEAVNGSSVSSEINMMSASRCKSPDSVSQTSALSQDVESMRSVSRAEYSRMQGNSRESGISNSRPGSAISGVSDGIFGGHFDGCPQISGRRSPGSHSVASSSSATTVIIAESTAGGMHKGAILDRQTRQTLGAILQEISIRAKTLLAKDDFTTDETVGDLNFLAHQSRYNADSGVKRRLLHRLAECSILDIFVKVFKSVHSVDSLFVSGASGQKNNGDYRHHTRNSSAASEAGDLDMADDVSHVGEEDLYAEVRSSASSPAMQNLVSVTTCLWHVNEKSPAVCEDSIRRGVIQVLLRDLDDPRLHSGELTKDASKLYLVRGYLGIFYSILKFFLDARELFRDFGAVKILKTYLKTTSALVKLKVLLVLSYVITEAENDELNANDKNIILLIKALHSSLESDVHYSKKYRCWAGEVAAGLNRLALCDSNKDRIIRKGVLPLYIKLLDPLSANEEEHMVAAQGLWSLLFSEEARRAIRAEPACKIALETLEKATQRDEVRRAVRGALFIISGRWNSPRSTTASVAMSPTGEVSGHVMLSFHQSSKPVVLRLREKMRTAGYKMWMDIEGMNSLESVADAMEKSSVVLICMSQRYKDSAACRTELEFAMRLRKDFVAVVVHSKFVPDGWLARAIGGKKVVDISSDDNMDSTLAALIQQLGTRGFLRSADYHDGSRSEITHAPSLSSVVTENLPTSPRNTGWSCDDVLHWLQENDLTHLADKFRRINGDLLTEIKRMQQRAPEHFYRTLHDDLQMDFITVLKFTRALGKL